MKQHHYGDFLSRHCPVNGISFIPNYELNTDVFLEIWRLTQDLARYWTLIKPHHKEFAEFCLNLSAMPAIMPKIDMKRIIDVLPKTEENFKSITITIIANDNCL